MHNVYLLICHSHPLSIEWSTVKHMAHLHDRMHFSRSSVEKLSGRRGHTCRSETGQRTFHFTLLYRDEVGTTLEALPYLHHVCGGGGGIQV